MKSGALKFEEVYRTFRPGILRYLARLAGQDEAEDLCQEVFTKIAQSLGGFKGLSSLSTWIYRIATNTALDRLRSKDPRIIDGMSPGEYDSELNIEDVDVWSGKKAEPLDRQLIRKEMNECIRDVVDKLPADYRTVIVLSEFEGFSNREIVEILGISLDTVKIRLHRARERLRKELQARCSLYKDERNELACDRKEPTVMTIKKK